MFDDFVIPEEAVTAAAEELADKWTLFASVPDLASEVAYTVLAAARPHLRREETA